MSITETKKPKANRYETRFTLGDHLEAGISRRLLEYRESLQKSSNHKDENQQKSPNASV